MSERELVAGIDLGGTHMQVGVVDESGAIIGRSRGKTLAAEGDQAVIGRMAKYLDEACREAGVSPGDLMGVGVGAPGAMDIENGVVLNAPNLRWKRVPLRDRLRERLNGPPVFVDNDVTVAVHGENRLGAGRNARNVMGVWVGTGIGGGLVLNGRLYQGGRGTAGEIGMTILYPDAAKGDERMEFHCSRQAVINHLRRRIDQGEASILTELVGDQGLDAISSSHVAEAHERGDELTRHVIEQSTRLLGISIANCVTLLSLPLVILGGGLVEELGRPYVDLVAKWTNESIHPPEMGQVEFRATELGPNAGLLGAAMLARDAFDDD